MRLAWVGVLVLSAIAVAAAPRKVTIKKRNGDVVKGAIVSEMDTGYLVKLEKTGKTIAVKFDDIADLNEGNVQPPPPPSSEPAPAASAQNLPPPPPPPPPPAYAPPVAVAAGPCNPGEVYVAFDHDDDVTGALCANRTEITVAEYQACVAARSCSADALGCSEAANWGHPDRATHPINCVSAPQAEAYCTWRQMRLPTLLEFQALATSPRHEGEYPWGDKPPETRVCWSAEGRRHGTCPVGSFPQAAGRGGILDIVGNVKEWTATELRRDRIFAGGAWTDEHDARVQRHAEDRNNPDVHYDDLGFRCVRSVR